MSSDYNVRASEFYHTSELTNKLTRNKNYNAQFLLSYFNFRNLAYLLKLKFICEATSHRL